MPKTTKTARKPRSADRPARKPPVVSPADVASIAAAIVRHRERAGLSSYQLAHAAGLSLPSLRAIELGRQPPALGTLLVIARALGLSPADLLRDLDG